MARYLIGESVPREEDVRLLRGRGRYVDDVRTANEARGYVLRSPHGSAKIVSIDTRAAKQMDGVLCVLTGEDVAARGLGAFRPVFPRKKKDGSPQFFRGQPILAQGHVRYVGDPVAFVVAETLNQAKDAAERIEVEYESLTAVVSVEDAVVPGAPAVWPDNPGNEAFYHTLGDKAATDAAFVNAAHVISAKMPINRITANTMEPRGCLAEYDVTEGRYILRASISGTHGARQAIADFVFKVPHWKVRVVAENVGGGFGMKAGSYPDYCLALWGAEVTGRPVRWIADRSEGLLSDDQARDVVFNAEMALDKDGKILGLRTKSLATIGAYFTGERQSMPSTAALGCLASTYTTPAIFAEVTGVFTNTMMMAFYRGGGRPEPLYAIETLLDKAARMLGMDGVELRRLNTVPASAMPYKTAVGQVYDCGDFPKNLEDALEIADYPGLAKRRAEAAKRGKLVGFGVSNTVAPAGGMGFEHAEVRFDPSGAVTMIMGSKDQGQGHTTTFKQVLCDKLGIDSQTIRYLDGDTEAVAIGVGSFGSRSAQLAGSAVFTAAEKLVAKGKKIAAHVFETAEGDIEFVNGNFTVAGTDKTVGIADIAKLSYQPGKLPKGMEPGFAESANYESPMGGTWPTGAHIVELEIDRDTGRLELTRYSAVDDVGVVLNPLLFHGQIYGGIAQGAGQAMMEHMIYEPGTGQVLTGSFMDYAMPRADDFCHFEIANNVVPTKRNPLGVKGAGESGTCGALPAVMNAVNDALASIGAPEIEMPATAEKIWRALQQAKKLAA